MAIPGFGTVHAVLLPTTGLGLPYTYDPIPVRSVIVPPAPFFNVGLDEHPSACSAPPTDLSGEAAQRYVARQRTTDVSVTISWRGPFSHTTVSHETFAVACPA